MPSQCEIHFRGVIYKDIYACPPLSFHSFHLPLSLRLPHLYLSVPLSLCVSLSNESLMSLSSWGETEIKCSSTCQGEAHTFKCLMVSGQANTSSWVYSCQGLLANRLVMMCQTSRFITQDCVTPAVEGMAVSVSRSTALVQADISFFIGPEIHTYAHTHMTYRHRLVMRIQSDRTAT